VTIVNGCPSLVDDDGRKKMKFSLKHMKSNLNIRSKP